ncbi:aminoglycoside efflux pump [Klebsiella pneumoniae]|uniref:Aminoglycoside efflux pump n=1 Tax=Klebsiella pneumoniae TaxID=573 RepID=A0A377YTJ8_KLEPN|nr:aminoglycoside efflux pump [Klebsiella pneumoniae]
MVPGSGAQNAVGTGVMGGMLTATLLAIFFVPVFSSWSLDDALPGTLNKLGYVLKAPLRALFFACNIGSQLNAPQSGNRHRTQHR